MIARALAAAAVVSLSVVGCASMERSGGEVRVSGVKDCASIFSFGCDVGVDTFCTEDATIPCVILVSDAVVKMKPRDEIDNKSRKISWSLPSSSEFKFASDGIAIDMSAFECPQKTDKKWHCRYKKDAPGKVEQFKYTIKLVHSNERRIEVLDPWVVTN